MKLAPIIRDGEERMAFLVLKILFVLLVGMMANVE